jgi:hypothetical protein
MLPVMELGDRVHAFDVDANDVGFAHLPPPVEPGDLVALDSGGCGGS